LKVTTIKHHFFGQDRERETGGCGWQDVSLESSVPVQPSLRAMTFP